MVHIGDLIQRSGIYTEPGVVVEKKDDGSVVVDTEPLSVNKYHRYSNTTGLSEADKERFNNILDRIYENEDNIAKLNDLQKEIDTLKIEPSNKNVVQYLRN